MSEAAELVKRLRVYGSGKIKVGESFTNVYEAIHEAADLIEAQAREIEGLKTALKPFAEFGNMMVPFEDGDSSPWVKAPDSTPVKDISRYGFTFKDFRQAALATKDTPNV